MHCVLRAVGYTSQPATPNHDTKQKPVLPPQRNRHGVKPSSADGLERYCTYVGV